jgi:hypothetical protein
VTAEGKLLTASAEDHGDLFWALRGGGNFGVVTSFEYHPVSTILGGIIVYPRNQATEVLRFYRTFTQSAPEELTAYAGLLHTPDGMPAVAVVACYCGDLAEGERVLKPAARVRLAAARRHAADALPADAVAARRSISGRQSELLEIGRFCASSATKGSASSSSMQTWRPRS